jgi:hypothetical protein
MQWVLTLVSRFLQNISHRYNCVQSKQWLPGDCDQKTTPQFACRVWCLVGSFFFSNNSKHVQDCNCKNSHQNVHPNLQQYLIGTNQKNGSTMACILLATQIFYSNESNNMPSKKSSCTAAPAHSYSSTRFRNARSERLSCSEQLCNLIKPDLHFV